MLLVRSRARAVSAVVAVALAAITAVPVQGADSVYTHPVTGVAEVTFGAESLCYEPPTELGLICHEYWIQYGQAGYGTVRDPLFPELITGVPARKQPWFLVVVATTWQSVGFEEGSDWEVIAQRWGETFDSVGYIDTTHLRTAAVTAFVPMSEGDPIALDLHWDLSDAPVQVSGNDGPVEGFSWGLHGSDGCTVQNFLAHQRWRWGGHTVTGSFDGMSMADLFIRPDNGAFIEGQSVFKIIIDETGVPCEPA